MLCKHKHDHVWLECIVVDRRCRGSKGKAKMEGYIMRRLINMGGNTHREALEKAERSAEAAELNVIKMSKCTV